MLQFQFNQSGRVSLYMNCCTTGNVVNLPTFDQDRMLDAYDMETAIYAYSGNLDARHVMPAGSSTGSNLSGIATTSIIYRGDA